jgi:hypothetical protein
MDDFSEVVVKIYKNIHTAIGLRAILLEGNTDEHRQIFKNTDAHHTRMMMQECLVTALTLSLSRVYERSQRNNSSLRRAFLLLEREEFITFIERTGSPRIRDCF